MALVTGAGKPRERTVPTYARWLTNHEQSHIGQIERIVNTLRTERRVTTRRRKEAIELVASKRDETGQWPLENMHPDQLDAEPGAAEGQPSRWNTLRALWALDWYATGA
jgi:hypothetical protein